MSKLIMYEWRCTECSTKFDALAKMDVLTHECPQCGAESKRLISTPRFDPKMGLGSREQAAYQHPTL
ncbi:MAG: FmdB family zinc ribbon protein [Planctomycetota bacterium]|jgi:putative FmdB family regulatory protein